MPTRLAALVAAGVFALSVMVGVPAAWAQTGNDRPLVDSPACATAVAADAAVKAATKSLTDAQDALAQIPVTTPPSQALTDAQAAVSTAQTNLDKAEVAATDTLCAEEAGEEEVTVESVSALIEALNCDGYKQQLGKINDDIRTLILETETTQEDIGALDDALDKRQKELNFCFDTTTPGTGDETVDPIGDDGSTADTSGSQVSDVPAGSAQTGA